MSTPPPRSARNFMMQLDAMTKHLKECHHSQWHGSDDEKNSAFLKLAQIVSQVPDQDTEDLLEIVKQALPEEMRSRDDDFLATIPIGPIIIALTYGYRAHKAHEVHADNNLSWSLMADCCYWSGIAATGRGLAEVNAGVRKRLALRGAEAKNKHHTELRTRAYQLVRDKCPQGGWPSVTHAVDCIANAFDKTLPASETIGIKTIYNWLVDMPDREHFLPEKKNRTKRQ